jgi:hypothetical protein
MACSRKILLAGVAAVGIGIAGAAPAQTAHVLTMPLPDGGLAQVRYIGDVPPTIALVPAPAVSPAASEAWLPVSSMFGPGSPFAMMDRIAAEMDRRAAAMFRYAEAMAEHADAGGIARTAAGTGPWDAMPANVMPSGGASYSFVSTVSGNGVCSQSVRIVSRGDGTKPLVERHSSGNCGAAAARSGRAGVQPASPVPAPLPKQPDLILTQGTGSPHAGMVRQVAAVR